MSSRSPYLLIFLVLTTLTATGIAWRQTSRLTALQAQLAQTPAPAQANRPPLPPLTDSEHVPPPLPTTSASAEPGIAVTEPPPETPPERPAADFGRPPGASAGFSALMANPDFSRAWQLQQRGALDARYAPLFKALNLTPTELENVKKLLVERQSAAMDVMNAARETGLNPRDNRNELRTLVSDAQAEIDANLRNALGDTRFKQYQDYTATLPQRNLVNQLDQRLGYSATTLSPSQTDFLVRTLAETSPVPANGGGPRSRVNITDEAITRASQVLSSTQLSALKDLQAELAAQQKVNELLRSRGRR